MANRDFKTMQSNIRELKQISLEISIGSSGAPTLSNFSSGYASIVRDNAGDYTITFTDKYSSFHGAEIIQVASSIQDLTFQIDAVDASSGILGFKSLTGTTATDPLSTSTLYVNTWFSNSSAQ